MHGVWNDLSQCTSSCKPSINFNICGCNGNDCYSYSPPIHEWSSGDYICSFNNFLLWLLVWLVVLLWHTASWRDGPPMNIQHLTSQKALYMKKCHSQRHQRKNIWNGRQCCIWSSQTLVVKILFSSNTTVIILLCVGHLTTHSTIHVIIVHVKYYTVLCNYHDCAHGWLIV